VEDTNEYSSHAISDISPGALKVLNMLGEYIFNEMKLNIENAFGIFDQDGSGEISVNEFLHILHRACGPDMESEKREVIAAMDKDGSKDIDIHEFAKTFGKAIGPNTRS
jgi:Ca2+-binding EF-hand superfamily protein